MMQIVYNIFNSGRPFWAPAGTECLNENYFFKRESAPHPIIKRIAVEKRVPICAACETPLPERIPTSHHVDCQCGLRMRRVRVHVESFADDVWFWRVSPPQGSG